MPTSITFDVNNLAMRNLFGPDVMEIDPKDKNNVLSVDYELWRYRFFDSVYKSLFKVKGAREVILAVDNPQSWRKIYWPRYKEQRKEKRDKLNLDWKEYFNTFESFLDELQQHFPFKIIRVKNAEADDIIGVLALNKTQDFHIISTDKDFLQLCSPRVNIYNPLKKKDVTHPNPELFLIQECFTGQAKDNIFNIKTPLDYPEGKRKPGFGEKTFEKVLASAGGWEKWLDDNGYRERFEFNRNLMDFERIPETIKKRILKAYDGYAKPSPDMIYEFFKNHPWPEYTENFTNIENKILEVY